MDDAVVAWVYPQAPTTTRNTILDDEGPFPCHTQRFYHLENSQCNLPCCCRLPPHQEALLRATASMTGWAVIGELGGSRCMVEPSWQEDCFGVCPVHPHDIPYTQDSLFRGRREFDFLPTRSLGCRVGIDPMFWMRVSRDLNSEQNVDCENWPIEVTVIQTSCRRQELQGFNGLFGMRRYDHRTGIWPMICQHCQAPIDIYSSTCYCRVCTVTLYGGVWKHLVKHIQQGPCSIVFSFILPPLLPYLHWRHQKAFAQDHRDTCPMLRIWRLVPFVTTLLLAFEHEHHSVEPTHLEMRQWFQHWEHPASTVTSLRNAIRSSLIRRPHAVVAILDIGDADDGYE